MEIFPNLIIIAGLMFELVHDGQNHHALSSYWNLSTVACEWFWHKLNYFLFCWNFEKIFSICAEILIITIKSNFEALQLLGVNLGYTASKSERWVSLDTIGLYQKDNKAIFIILYKYYLSKISEIKKPTAKMKIWNLINYLAVCCWICLGTMVLR